MDIYSQLYMYNAENYDSFAAAWNEDAVYSTASTIDNLSSLSGVLDMLEIVECFESLHGNITLTAGVIDQKSEFVTLGQLKETHEVSA